MQLSSFAIEQCAVDSADGVTILIFLLSKSMVNELHNCLSGCPSGVVFSRLIFYATLLLQHSLESEVYSEGYNICLVCGKDNTLLLLVMRSTEKCRFACGAVCGTMSIWARRNYGYKGCNKSKDRKIRRIFCYLCCS